MVCELYTTCNNVPIPECLSYTSRFGNHERPTASGFKVTFSSLMFTVLALVLVQNSQLFKLCRLFVSSSCTSMIYSSNSSDSSDSSNSSDVYWIYEMVQYCCFYKAWHCLILKNILLNYQVLSLHYIGRQNLPITILVRLRNKFTVSFNSIQCSSTSDHFQLLSRLLSAWLATQTTYQWDYHDISDTSYMIYGMNLIVPGSRIVFHISILRYEIQFLISSLNLINFLQHEFISWTVDDSIGDRRQGREGGQQHWWTLGPRTRSRYVHLI